MAGSLSQSTRTNGETGGPEVAPGFMTLQMSLEDIPGYLVTNQKEWHLKNNFFTPILSGSRHVLLIIDGNVIPSQFFLSQLITVTFLSISSQHQQKQYGYFISFSFTNFLTPARKSLFASQVNVQSFGLFISHQINCFFCVIFHPICFKILKKVQERGKRRFQPAFRVLSTQTFVKNIIESRKLIIAST